MELSYVCSRGKHGYTDVESISSVRVRRPVGVCHWVIHQQLEFFRRKSRARSHGKVNQFMLTDVRGNRLLRPNSARPRKKPSWALMCQSHPKNHPPFKVTRTLVNVMVAIITGNWACPAFSHMTLREPCVTCLINGWATLCGTSASPTLRHPSFLQPF